MRALSLLCVAACGATALGEQASLRDCGIYLEAGRPAYVHRAVEDLREVIARQTGTCPAVHEGVRAGRPEHPIIEIMRREPVQIAAGPKPDQQAETFSIVTRYAGEGAGRRLIVAVSGSDDAGLAAGVLRLLRHLRLHEKDVTVEVPLAVTGQPRFQSRGMYAHLHWSYKRPYALRSWELQDWKRYVDLLAHLGFNTIQIWPMMELLPHPLSPEDKAYLERFSEIVRHAHKQRGMRVFIGSCPNNITEDARGVPISKREYFDFEKLLDPGDPASLARILEYRSDLYRTVPDADGYWVIDSDPGGWKGSPSSVFVDVLRGHQELIRRHGQRPEQQPLIYWMWYSWGTGTHEENWRATLTDAKSRLAEPWMLHVCLPEHLAMARELDLLGRAIFFPYNLVETEPSAPLTDLRFARIAAEVRSAEQAGIRGLQGNAQTPLAQLPNIAALAHAGWGGDPEAETELVLGELAERLLAREAGVLKNAWKSLNSQDAEGSRRLGARLRELAADDSARGTLAVVLGDWQRLVLQDLASMLDIHTAAVEFAKLAAGDAEANPLSEALATYIATTAAYLERTGYHGVRIVDHEAYRHNVVRGIEALTKRIGEEKLLKEVYEPALASASRGHSAEICQAISESILGRRK